MKSDSPGALLIQCFGAGTRESTSCNYVIPPGTTVWPVIAKQLDGKNIQMMPTFVQILKQPVIIDHTRPIPTAGNYFKNLRMLAGPPWQWRLRLTLFKKPMRRIKVISNGKNITEHIEYIGFVFDFSLLKP